MDATTPFASGTTANFRAGFVRGWGLKYVEVDRAKDGIRSAGRSLSNRGYCCHHIFSNFPLLPLTSSTRVVPRSAGSRLSATYQSPEDPCEFARGPSHSRRSSCGSKSRANRLLNRVTRNLNKDPAGRFVAVCAPLFRSSPLRERSYYHIRGWRGTNEMNNF